jgi:AraC-like DNA-binding protein
MQVIYLIGCAQALFFLALLRGKKPFTKGDRLLMVWIGGIGIHLLAFYVLMKAWFDQPYGIIMLLIPPLIYLYGPLLWIYTLWSAGKIERLAWKHYLHFIPLALSVINYAYLYFFPAAMDLNFFRDGAAIHPITGMIFYLLNILLNPFYVVITLVQIHKHQKNIKSAFSYKERIDLQWVQFLAYTLGGISVIVWISHALIAFGIIERNYAADQYIFIPIALFMFVLGYYGFKQGVIFKYTPTLPKENIISKYKKSALNEASAQALLDRLEQYILAEKSYEINQLSLRDLSEALEVPPYQISQVLNTKLGKNFFDYINAYRIAEVKRRMADPSHNRFSILGIALDSGFNSKASFNRTFKDQTGTTPSAYKKSLKKVSA